jgi:hypothetical protein
MKKEYQLLSDYCRWDDNSRLVKLLREQRNLDLTQRDGVYFYLAVKHGNVAMLRTLLKYYEETKLQGDRESLEYKLAKHQLGNILEDAKERLDISPEIQEIIELYMPTDEESEDDLEGFDEYTDQWEDDDSPRSPLDFPHNGDGIAAEDIGDNYAPVKIMGDMSINDPLAAEDHNSPFSPYSPFVTGC